MAHFIEVKVTYRKTIGDVSQKKVSELYLADALSVPEAEERVTQELSPYKLEEYEVSAVKKSAVSEILFSASTSADHFYLAKVGIITINEKTNAEKLTSVTYLIQAVDIHNALNSLCEDFKGTMTDYKILSLSESKIVDVFIHK